VPGGAGQQRISPCEIGREQSTMTHPVSHGRSGRLSRRDCLKSASAGFGWLALAGLCQHEASAYESPLAPKQPHFQARAKRVIFLCMRGGPSQMESFDYKPKLNADNLKPGRAPNCKLFGSQWKFAQHGEAACGFPSYSRIWPGRPTSCASSTA
jgi:hypothetical protein